MIKQTIESYSGYLQIQNPAYFDDPTLDNSFVLNDSLLQAINANPDIKVAVPRIETFALASTGVQSKGILVCGIDPEAEKNISNPEHRIIRYRLTTEAIDSLLKMVNFPEKQVALLKSYENTGFTSLSRIELDLSLNKDLSKQVLPLIEKLTKIKGSYLKPDDNGVLVSDRLSRFLKVSVGDTIVLMGQGFEGYTASGLFPVRGIVKIPSPELDNKVLYMSLSLAQQLYSMQGRVTSMAINLVDTRTMTQVQEKLSKMVNPSEYVVKNWKELNPTLEQQIQGDNKSGQVFIGILYFIVFFGIFGTVIMMIAERRREFGVMVAIGMSKRNLSKILLVEMLFVGLIGTLSGMLASVPLIISGFNRPIKYTGDLAKMMEDMGFDPIMPMAWFDHYFTLQGIIILIMVLLACYVPLRNIRKMKVINALKA